MSELADSIYRECIRAGKVLISDTDADIFYSALRFWMVIEPPFTVRASANTLSI